MSKLKANISLGLIAVAIIAAVALSSCASIPKKATPAQDFNLQKYLGTWYEIARFDYKFEENLNNVTATYSLNPDGTVQVVNKGYNFKTNEWESATGKAKFRESKNTAALKVSFFGPFYSGYNVIALSGDYKYALVAGKNLDYLWILSRTTDIPERVKKEFLQKAEQIGYDTSRLVWVKHDKA